MSHRRLRTKALLIDLDGTIVDSSQVIAEAVETALSAHGINSCGLGQMGWEIARRLQLNAPVDEIFDRSHVDKSLREEFLKTFLQSFYNIAATRTKLIPGVDKTLCKLSKKFLLALITRRRISKNLVKKELERLDLDGYFRTIITSLEVKRPTPFPDTILKAADELQVPVHQCAVVSDSGVDVEGGKSAGAKTVAVLSGLFKEEELSEKNPDLIIKDINYIPGYVLPIR